MSSEKHGGADHKGGGEGVGKALIEPVTEGVSKLMEPAAEFGINTFVDTGVALATGEEHTGGGGGGGGGGHH